MVEQPSGTVTLVFTDIEGSTRLLHELGQDAYLEVLAEHRRILRGACARHAGYEVDYEGDSFFYAFQSAAGAVAAVEEAMRGLERGPIRLRVGVHTGKPGLDPPKYVGLDVHLGARARSDSRSSEREVRASIGRTSPVRGDERRGERKGSQDMSDLFILEELDADGAIRETAEKGRAARRAIEGDA
jgi:class 3 adenylate cyclase